MKNFFLIVGCVAYFYLGADSLFGVDFEAFDAYQYRLTHEQVRNKIQNCLEKDAEIRRFYKLTAQALYIGDLEHQQIDYVLHLNEGAPIDSERHTVRHGLKGAKIAIDPGHFGGAFAKLEERYVEVPASKTRNGHEIFLREGDLTYLTAIELKRLLEAEGAVVFITRAGIGTGALEEDFFAWIQRHPGTESSSKVFREHYNSEDLKQRAEKINAFSPDITLVIHYNAHLTAAEKEAGAMFTQSNYNLAFIPGAFVRGELKTKEDRYEFLRLLVTNVIEESQTLSGCIVREFVHHLQVPLIAPNDSPSYIGRACLPQTQGIYCRNLVLTRLVHSPVCYGETLIQNHEEEVYRLASDDMFIMGVACSKRVREVAQAYYDGIKRYYCSMDKE